MTTSRSVERTKRIHTKQLVIAAILVATGVVMMLATGQIGIYLDGPAAGVSLPPGLAIIGAAWFLIAGLLSLRNAR